MSYYNTMRQSRVAYVGSESSGLLRNLSFVSDSVFCGFSLFSFILISIFFSTSIMRSSLLFTAIPVLWVAAFSFNSYDLGFYGIYPRQYFHSVEFEAPAPKITRWDSRCNSGNLLLTPRGPSVVGAARGPVMLDARGNLVWMDNKRFEQAMNLNVQKYNGQDYLTFWTKTKKTSHAKHSKKSYVLVGPTTFLFPVRF